MHERWNLVNKYWGENFRNSISDRNVEYALEKLIRRCVTSVQQLFHRYLTVNNCLAGLFTKSPLPQLWINYVFAAFDIATYIALVNNAPHYFPQLFLSQQRSRVEDFSPGNRIYEW